jgi:Asp-tRNA(Asn)/Glu-tRNA(Gln) amidotransferase A subunit family amidase
MGRDVADTAFMLQSSLGPHPMDPLSLGVRPGPVWPLPEVDLRGLRVAYTEDFGACAVDPMIRRVFRDRVAAVAREVAVCEPLDWRLEDGHRCFDVIRAESFVAAFEAVYRTQPDTLGPNVRANVEMAARITLADRAWAHLAQTAIFRRFQAAFGHYDLILAPVTPLSPFPWTELYAATIDGQTQRNYYEWLSLTYLVTLATHPALALPCGRDEAGMPFGLQVVGPLHQDGRLLALGAALERHFAADPRLARPRPDEAVLARPRPDLRSLVTHPPRPGGDDAAPTGTAV